MRDHSDVFGGNRKATTLHEMLEKNAHLFPERAACLYEHSELGESDSTNNSGRPGISGRFKVSYARLNALADEVAHALLKQVVLNQASNNNSSSTRASPSSPSSTTTASSTSTSSSTSTTTIVFLMVPKGLCTLTSYFGVMKAGACAAPLDATQLDAPDGTAFTRLEMLRKQYAPKAIVVTKAISLLYKEKLAQAGFAADSLLILDEASGRVVSASSLPAKGTSCFLESLDVEQDVPLAGGYHVATQ